MGQRIELQKNKEMVETAKYLAENDHQALLIAKAGMDLLKARSDLEKANSEAKV